MDPLARLARTGRLTSCKSLTPPAIIAVENINKELTPEGSFEAAAPVITIRLVNGRLMAKRVFSRI
jgi:hypothetical protein